LTINKLKRIIQQELKTFLNDLNALLNNHITLEEFKETIQEILEKSKKKGEKSCHSC
jgi:rRNA maturation protein Rpf1